MSKMQERAVLYLRQSTFREESISLELQETAGRQYCKEKGYRVVAVLADPGISGRTWNRPAVQEVMAMVENRKADVIVLWKWSRLSRSRRDWAIAVDKVDVAGGRIESATEPLDVATSTGRLARGLMMEFAAFESERIGDTWREAHQRRIKSGRPINGKARWGYLYDLQRKVHYPDPAVAPIVKQVFERYITGEAFISLRNWLNEIGDRPAAGYGPQDLRLWSDHTLRRTMTSGFQAGFFTANGVQYQGVHEAIISEDTWHQFLEQRKARGHAVNSERSQYLLSGMVYCGECGSKCHASKMSGRSPLYVCRNQKQYALHKGGRISVAKLDGFVKEWIASLALQDPRFSMEEPLSVAKGVEASKEVAGVEARLTSLTNNFLDGIIPQETYEGLRDQLILRKQKLDQIIKETRSRKVRKPAPLIAAELINDWDILPLENRRVLLKELIERVTYWPFEDRGTPRIVEITPN